MFAPQNLRNAECYLCDCLADELNQFLCEQALKNVKAAQHQLGKLEEVRRDLEEEVANISRDQELSDKTTGHQIKLIKVSSTKTILSNASSHFSFHDKGHFTCVAHFLIVPDTPHPRA